MGYMRQLSIRDLGMLRQRNDARMKRLETIIDELEARAGDDEFSLPEKDRQQLWRFRDELYRRKWERVNLKQQMQKIMDRANKNL
ncbi:MAG: hypothetical protein JSW39_22750 [Desulfobacterales bacterium]|nr:MAG: hypothetical protein JSW39_22750 [Desulfobacterales bacterium]